MTSSIEIATQNEAKIELKQSLALQTYEFFNGGSVRQEQIQAFIDGKSDVLTLDYPDLEDTDVIDAHIGNLYAPVMENTSETATAEYRLAEAYFLKAAARLSTTARGPVGQSEIDSFQNLNESIYGQPGSEVVDQMLSRVWGLINAAQGPAVDGLVAELKQGTVYTAADGSTHEIPALPLPEKTEISEFPELSDHAIEWLKNTLREYVQPAIDVFTSFYDQNKEMCDTEGIKPEDVVHLFKDAANAMGIDIGVLPKPDATLLSWSSSDEAVHVGLRRKPLKSVDELIGVFVHEVVVHGQRCKRGYATGVSELGSGLFTEAEPGEDPSYLTFEEGLASTLQAAVQGKKESWTMASMSNYLGIALAHKGWSSRQIHEVMHRVRTVIGTKPEQEEVSEKTVQLAKKNSTASLVRIFRGTPVDKEYKTSDGVTLHYAKDLCYAAGKLKAITLLNDISQLPSGERDARLMQILSAKYDPTNVRQKTLVELGASGGKVEV